MPAPDPAKTRTFRDAAAFESWLAKHHEAEVELWLKLHKKGSGLPSITYAEAVECALCWGWIDGIRKALDDVSFLQRFTPRTARSRWSQINCGHVERLIAAGRMRPAGMRQVEAARADGRWDSAYAPPSASTLPADLLRAIEAVPAARATLQSLGSQDRFALAYRLHHLKTDAGREKAIQRFVAQLARGETFHPSPRSRGVAAAEPSSARPAPRQRRSPKAPR